MFNKCKGIYSQKCIIRHTQKCTERDSTSSHGYTKCPLHCSGLDQEISKEFKQGVLETLRKDDIAMLWETPPQKIQRQLLV